jgi:eukaryotic-like serine/threonine-protein kinase
MVPAMRGVHAAHQVGVIHRDLKPENIILSESDGQIVPKVLDFGVSKLVGGSGVPNSSLTRTGALVGTPHYMALEQIDGSNAIDARTDVYAFGVLLYRALTGSFPFDGTNLGEVILKIGTREPAPMRLLRADLPPELDALVLRSLSRDRDKRFSNVDEQARALLHSVGATADIDSFTPGAVQFRTQSGGSRQGTEADVKAHALARATPPIEERAGRRRALWIGGALAIALLLAAVVLTRREAEAARTPLASEAATKSPVGAASSAAPSGTPASSVLAPAPAPAMQAGQSEPVAPATKLAQAPGVAPIPAPDGATPQQPAASLRIEKRGLNGPKLVRTQAAPRKPTQSAPALIPGERTNGFSVDDF